MKSIFIFFVAFLFVLSSCKEKTVQTETADDQVEQVAPSSTVMSEKMETRYLETAIGKIPVYETFDEVAPYFEKEDDATYVINFWATWCKPCVEELPYFEQIHENYKDQKVKVVLVSMDFERQLETKLKSFLSEYQLQSDVVVLTDNKYNNWIDRVDESWDGAIPVTMIYNANKKQFFSDQFEDFEDLESALKQFL